MTLSFSPNHFDQFAVSYQQLRSERENPNLSQSQRIKIDQKIADQIDQMAILVHSRVARYQRFPNGPDLVQEGFEALLKALESYRDQKSAFSWWADKYITTQVNRAVVSQMERKHQKSGKSETKLNSISGTVYLTHELPLDPETIILDLEEKNMVTLAISELNDRDQKLINASISSEMGKIKKTAGQLNLTKPAAADRIKRLKKRITKTIRERI